MKSKRFRLNVEFCTECGEQLDEFDMSPVSKDIRAVRANHENCKKSGKYRGEFCSKLFISIDGEVPLEEEIE